MPEGVPVWGMPAAPVPSLSFDTAVMEATGRVRNRGVLAALGWGVGKRLRATVVGGSVVIYPDRHGPLRLSASLSLGLPARVRAACGVRVGDRVLLAADAVRGVLAVHPPAAVTEMLGWLHGRLAGGDR
ncbi:hypothetical protein ABZ863_11090 [Saccharomonospora sp. NPDC046836]|uniref:hypothetical protein n=1 Tax=Saccharomonospora sp. NPDC046836 TaxID=3156921 RepID=UPI0033E14395